MSLLRCHRGFGWGSRRIARGVRVASFFVVLLGEGAPADADFVIVPTFDASITNDPNALAIEGTINAAIRTYETTFSDPITVTISFREMSTGLSSSNWWFYTLSYSTFLNALKADAKTGNDAIALAHLPNGANNPVTGTGLINVKTAEIRALGIPGNFPSGLAGGVDGIVGVNTLLTDIGSPGTSGQYSLRAQTEHEIDEVLGLSSAVPSTTPSPEDLFRYDQNGNRSYTANSSAQAFFSLDATTKLAQFNNDQLNQGGDFGDWESKPRPFGAPARVQDAFATPLAQPTLGVELTALDVIGYDLVSVPEPSSLVGAATGVGVVMISAYASGRRRAA